MRKLGVVTHIDFLKIAFLQNINVRLEFGSNMLKVLFHSYSRTEMVCVLPYTLLS